MKKIPALRGNKSEIPGPSPQDLGIPIGQISSPSYASRTLAPSSHSMHSQNSRARSRSLRATTRRAACALVPRLPLPRRRTLSRRPSLPLMHLMLATQKKTKKKSEKKNSPVWQVGPGFRSNVGRPRAPVGDRHVEDDEDTEPPGSNSATWTPPWSSAGVTRCDSSRRHVLRAADMSRSRT